MRRICIDDRPDWPRFRWDEGALATQLAAVRHHQGRLLGQMDALGFDLRAETNLVMPTRDALATSEIEGELLDADQVRSSLARRLGLERGGLRLCDRKADAIAQVVLDATRRFEQKLTPDRLFVSTLDQALSDADMALAATLARSRCWQEMATLPLNARQHTVLLRVLDGWVGKLTSSNGPISPRARKTPPCATSTT